MWPIPSSTQPHACIAVCAVAAVGAGTPSRRSVEARSSCGVFTFAPALARNSALVNRASSTGTIAVSRER